MSIRLASPAMRAAALASCLLTAFTAWGGAKMSTPHSAGVDAHGRAGLSIPIEVPPGSGGMVPSLTLTYSNQGDGIAGIGWSLGVVPYATRTRNGPNGVTTESGAETAASAITRCPSTIANDGIMGGVKLDSSDRFCLDGQRLVVHGTGTYGADGTEYRTEVESFTRVISYGTAGNGPAWFNVWTKSGLILEYGNTADSRIEAPGTTTPRSWAVNRVSDRSTNYYTTTYSEDTATGEFVVAQIDYTGNANAGLVPYNSIVFSYETRPDTTVAFVAGSAVQRRKRLFNIKTFAEGTPTKQYWISYALSNDTSRSLVASVTECSMVECLPGISFGYTSGGGGITQPASLTPVANMVAPATMVSLQPGDFNGDGVQDVFVKDSNGNYRICYGPDFTASSCTTPHPYAPDVMVLDFDGDGFSDLGLHYANGTFVFCKGSSPVPGPNCYAPQSPSVVYAGYKFIAGDFDGDGLDEIFGWNTQNPNESWGIHCNVLYILNGAVCNGRAMNGTNFTVHKGDFDGDGMTDLLFAGTSTYHVCTSRSMSGAVACATVSAPSNWRDNSQIVVGDFNGDGHADLLRLLTNGLEQCAGPGFMTSNAQNRIPSCGVCMTDTIS